MEDIFLSDFQDERFKRAFRAYFEELGLKIRDWDGLFREMDSDGRGNLCWLRLDGDETVGFIQFCPMELSGWFFTGSFGFIREFWTAPDYRGQGHGSALLGLAEGYMRGHGMPGVILTTDTAPEFYEKHGYRAAPEFAAKNKMPVYIKSLGRPDGEPVEIRPADVSEPDILGLFSQHDDYMIDFLGEDSHYYTRYSGDENIEAVWAAYSGGTPIGCIAYRGKAKGVGEVKRLFINEAYRGRGTSKLLLETVERYARQLGCRKLYLDTRSTLEPAVSIYRAAGFRVVFQQGLYIQMEKELGA